MKYFIWIITRQVTKARYVAIVAICAIEIASGSHREAQAARSELENFFQTTRITLKFPSSKQTSTKERGFSRGDIVV